ncbi:hypothetical protein Pmani_016421 [Petrolisthes manimaculis]|uniref:Major facilitator superfamily (MFS) profile domain-containing protein n=1 Tax=Petrolisthes manimaculis TaxID=1843537 RepID=A0AAE1PQ47_9EUCA|nr:hypothetical protein Pmani_016421 [Petrolisthes manimaculis]
MPDGNPSSKLHTQHHQDTMGDGRSTSLEEGRGQIEAATTQGRQGNNDSNNPLVVYKQRWAVLVTVTLLNISNAGLWINTAPVSYKAVTYFGVTLDQVNWFSLVFLFVSIPFCFISTFSVNQLGLKAAIHTGSALNTIGALIRLLSTCGIISDGKTQYAVGLGGQVLAGMAQSFLLFIPTKVSQLWFPEDARALSTTILALSNPLGILVTQVISPLLVPESDNLPTLNYVFGGLAVCTQVVTLICITRSKPPTPPSYSAERGEKERQPYLQQLKSTFTTVPYLLLLLALGCGVALFSALATVTAQILCPLGYDDVFSGIVMGVMILCGFVGSAVTGITADRTKAFTPITKLCYGAAAIFAIIMMEMFMVPDQRALVAITTGLFGFFGVGAYPIGLELAVEATYPVEESISTAFIFMSGQVQGVIIIAMVSLLSTDLNPKYNDVEVCSKGTGTDLEPRDYTVSLCAIMSLLTFVVVLIIVFFNTPYKRLEAERAQSNTNVSSSSSSSSSSTPHSSGYSSENASRGDTTSPRTKKIPTLSSEQQVLLQRDPTQTTPVHEEEEEEEKEVVMEEKEEVKVEEEVVMEEEEEVKVEEEEVVKEKKR